MLRSLINWWKERDFHKLRHRPVAVIFSDIYRNNVWGGKPGTFYSGTGTHNPNAHLYIEAVRKFISEKNVRSILEIGCGDFSIMQEVLRGTNVQYTGADVVAELIADHQKTFQGQFQFQQIDAIDDSLPDADLLIIRQVLQHLSNDHIGKILSKIPAFRYVLITEHLPLSSKAIPNLDKITGPHIRMKKNSGVFIDQPPFNVAHTSVLLEYREDDRVKGEVVPAVIRTSLVENLSTS